MRNLYKFSILTFLLSIGFILSCKKDKNSAEFDSPQMFLDITKNVILPNISAFKSDVTKLKSVLQILKNNPTEATLQGAQNQLVNTSENWHRCEFFNLGEVKNSFIYLKINTWPTNTTKLLEHVVGSETLSSSFIDNSGSSVKGLPAIEYLLFDNVNGNQAILDSLLTSVNASRKLEYLLALGSNLEQQSIKLEEIWTGGYALTFVGNKDEGFGGSLALLINEISHKTEHVVLSKIREPLNLLGNPAVNIVFAESFRSGKSLSHIKNNLNTLEACFKGSYSDPETIGLYDLLQSSAGEDKLISEVKIKISTQINKLQILMNDYPESYEETFDISGINLSDFYDEWRNLLVLIKVDMPHELGVAITISDNDGD
jgi:predicted lipoprotein